MKSSTLNHVAMYQSVLSCIRDHESEWSAIPKFVENVGQMEYLLDRLQENFGFQAVKTLGANQKKQIFRNDLLNLVDVLKRGLFLLSKDTNNVELKMRNKDRRSFYERISDQKLQIICAILLIDTDEFEAELQPYGISASLIQDFRDKVAVLEETNFSTRKAIIDRSIATSQIDFFEKALNKLVREEMDSLMIPFKSTNSAFFTLYKKMRKVINKNGGRPVHPAERDDGAAA